MLSVVMLNAIYPECRYADKPIMLSVVMLSVVMLSVIYPECRK